MKLKKISALMMIPALAVSLAACGGSGKPSKEEVKAGITTAVEEQMGGEASGLTDEQMDQLMTCIVDETYDKASDDTLRSLADGEEPDASADSEDAQIFTDASTTCAQQLMEDLVG